jgi:hypothetical protein
LRISFEGDSLGAIVGDMRAFLAAVDRRPPVMAPAAADGTYTGPALPPCPVHMVEMDYRPAGTNQRTHRRYSASYRCPREGCREAQWIEPAARR